MKWQVLFLALCCASVQALHVTRPLVTPFKQMLKQGADGRLRAEKAKACHAQQSKDTCLQSACIYCSSPYEGVHSGCYHPMESLRMPKSKETGATATPLFQHTSAYRICQASALIGISNSLLVTNVGNEGLYMQRHAPSQLVLPASSSAGYKHSIRGISLCFAYLLGFKVS